MWQEVIVGICVLAALVFVVRRYVFAGKKNGGSCGGCNGCGGSKQGCSK